jgi:hypothetical protein
MEPQERRYVKLKYNYRDYLKLVIPRIVFIILDKIQYLLKDKSNNDFGNLPGKGIIKLNDELFILGNSPSINELDVSVLFGRDVFLCNDFHKHPKFNYIKENCNVTYFALDSLKSLQNGIIYHKKLDEKKFIMDYYGYIFSENYITVIPIDLYEYLNNNKLFTNCKIEYYEFNSLKNYFKSKLCLQYANIVNLHLALSVRQTPNGMLQYGLLKDYAIINLYGLQHSYVKDRFDSLSRVFHFYIETKEEFQNMEHRDLTELFLDSHLTFKVYKELNKLAKLLNINIYDYTIDGCLDMFEKRKI